MIETVKEAKFLFKNKGIDPFFFEYRGCHGINSEAKKIIPESFDIIVFDPAAADWIKIGFLEKFPLWLKKNTLSIAFYGTKLTDAFGFVNLGCCYTNFDAEISENFIPNFIKKSRS